MIIEVTTIIIISEYFHDFKDMKAAGTMSETARRWMVP